MCRRVFAVSALAALAAPAAAQDWPGRVTLCFSVIPTEAEPLDFARDTLREAKRRDLVMCSTKRRSLHSASLQRGYDPRESG